MWRDQPTALPPDTQGRVFCSQDKVTIGSQHRQAVTDTKLGQHRVDCSELHSGATTSISQLGSVDVILPIWHQQRKRGKPLNDRAASPWADKGATPWSSEPPNDRHMAETAAHLADHVFLPLPVRQWVLSIPKRLRYFLQHEPEAISAVLHILLRVIEARLCQRSGCTGVHPRPVLGPSPLLQARRVCFAGCAGNRDAHPLVVALQHRELPRCTVAERFPGLCRPIQHSGLSPTGAGDTIAFPIRCSKTNWQATP
jgi:hypothetical protein